MNLILLAATLAGSLEMRTQIVRDHCLQVLLVPHGRLPVVMVPSVILGCYVSVDVLDESGVLIGHLGPRATCKTPALSEYRALRADDTAGPNGSDIFGAEFDLLAPDRVRLGVDGELGALKPGLHYQFVVNYHNDETNRLGPRERASLRARHGEFWSSAFELKSRPTPFRCPS